MKAVGVDQLIVRKGYEKPVMFVAGLVLGLLVIVTLFVMFQGNASSAIEGFFGSIDYGQVP